MSDDIREMLERATTIAVIGMKPPGGGAAYSVPSYMAQHGYRIIAANPNYDSCGDFEVVDRVDLIDEPVDIVDIFRRSDAVDDHVDEILAMEPLPSAVWLQLGIRNDEAAARLESAGIRVIQDKCIKVEHSRRF